MILTITLNPSMDYNYLVSSLTLDEVNRVENPHTSIGGKGINAGRVIAKSGEKVVLTGILGGPVGKMILDTLIAEKCYQLEFLTVEGNSRNAITIMHDENTHTELVEKGLYLSSKNEQLFFEHVATLIKRYPIDVICISGSVNSDNQFFHAELLAFIRALVGEEFPILMDISGKQLENVLSQTSIRPSFIKPNTHELEELIGQKIHSTEELITALEQPLFDNIETIMISQGGDGALVKRGEAFYDIQIPEIEIVNTTGCGDSTVGGMAFAISQGFSVADAIKYAMACGMSNSLFETNGTIDKTQVTRFMQQIQIQALKKFSVNN
ncbi:1-phosphofructokinase family hexose kinase [Enterococcus pseudoavium]|uniref:Tagatose-6-phosphate kinase n=1 Tax=Enterococcus pseudoavium TaxID=44007 RepID=A0ABU3FE70_9ENTE|nr:1-phosphofructokinase family hexose kinase [Enterococcus pseudoavium]MDT2754607.1 1-phosphofructokinase family hexose kinase [Enterococcus pseudoavium]MDT2769338.1 1-phosphofructokinase family hexose kinase [Enterococcus pseudoavium]